MKREVIECDRCGGPVPVDSTEHRDFAGRLYAATYAGSDRVGTSVVPADLCGGCMDDLVEFMGGRSLERPGSDKAAKRARETA